MEITFRRRRGERDTYVTAAKPKAALFVYRGVRDRLSLLREALLARPDLRADVCQYRAPAPLFVQH